MKPGVNSEHHLEWLPNKRALAVDFLSLISGPCSPSFFQPVTPSPRLRILGDGQLLQIQPTQLSDSGRYLCVASNVAGEDSQDFTVFVQGAWAREQRDQWAVGPVGCRIRGHWARVLWSVGLGNSRASGLWGAVMGPVAMKCSSGGLCGQ